MFVWQANQTLLLPSTNYIKSMCFWTLTTHLFHFNTSLHNFFVPLFVFVVDNRYILLFLHYSVHSLKVISQCIVNQLTRKLAYLATEAIHWNPCTFPK